MPNPIKYTTGSETLALKKGNFYIGTGDVGKGPSDSTGYYNGISPSSGGYVIYMNKSGAPGSLSYHNAPTDSELITFTNNLAGQSYTSVTQCLTYFASQTDKVCLNIDYSAVITDSLIFNSDAGFSPSYPQSGTTWYDLSLSGSNCTLYNSPTYSGGSIVFDGVDDYASLGNISYNRTNFSCFVWFNATSYYNNWRSGVFTKWTSTNFPSMSEWSIGFNASSGPSNFGAAIQKDLTTVGNYLIVTGGDNYVLNAWYNLGFTWNSGVLSLYLNGSLINSGSTNVTVPNTTNQPVMIASFADGTTYSSPMRVSNAVIYNKTLSNSEILQNYQSMFPRFLGENIVTNGLIFYVDAGYRTSYSESGTTFYDVSGYGNNGTLVNGVGFNSLNGGSFVFDGTDDNAYTNSNINLLPLGDNPRTMSYWIYPTKNTSQTLIQIAGYGLDNGVGNLFAGSIDGNGKSFLWANSNNYTSTHNITLNTWQQITWVKTPGNIVCYKNGVADNGGSYTINTVASRPYMGKVYSQNIYDKYQGNIGNFNIYNRALSASEVLQNYNAQKSRFGL